MRSHHPPSLSDARQNSWLSIPDSTVLWNLQSKDFSSSVFPLTDLPYLASPSVYTSPTRPPWRLLSHRSILALILSWIFLYLRTPNLFLITMWTNTRGLSEFKLLSKTPCHPAARIAVNCHHTAPEVVAYQLDHCASSQSQQRCQIASSRTPLSR